MIAVPWFIPVVHLSVLWCLSGMLAGLKTRFAPTCPSGRDRRRPAAPDNTNKGTQ